MMGVLLQSAIIKVMDQMGLFCQSCAGINNFINQNVERINTTLGSVLKRRTEK